MIYIWHLYPLFFLLIQDGGTNIYEDAAFLMQGQVIVRGKFRPLRVGWRPTSSWVLATYFLRGVFWWIRGLYRGGQKDVFDIL
jgi:hypothetical protein